jgi:hypothetical protein
MVFGTNMILNGSGETGDLQNWTTTNTQVITNAIERLHYFQVTAGKMSQSVAVQDYNYPPSIFRVHVECNTSSEIIAGDLSIFIQVIMHYTDGTIETFYFPIQFELNSMEDTLPDSWIITQYDIPVNEIKVPNQITVTIDNTLSTAILQIDNIKLLQDTGAQGPEGPIGPEGPQGPQGPAGAVGRGYRIRGQWASGVTYYYNATYIDLVSYNGSTFYCKVTHTSSPTNPPSGAAVPVDTTQWGVTAMQGAQGPIGQIGPQGPIGDMGPQGPQGLAGADGVQGPAGPTYRNTGAWLMGTTYVNNAQYIDTVNFNGSLFVSKLAVNLNHQPPSTAIDDDYWVCIVAKGDTGPILDWVQDWDGSKTTINGVQIVTPKIFAGINGSGDPANPVLTGVAIGRDILGGADSSIGIGVYNNNVLTSEIGTDGHIRLGTSGATIYVDTNGQVVIQGQAISLESNPIIQQMQGDITGNKTAAETGLNDAISSVNQNIGATDTKVNEIKEYFHFGDSGIQLGRTDSPMQITMEVTQDNAEIALQDNGTKVVYINGKKASMTDVEISGSVIIGHHQFERVGGMTILRYLQ